MEIESIATEVVRAWEPVKKHLDKLVELGYSSGFFDWLLSLDLEKTKER